MSHKFKCKITHEITLEIKGTYFPGRPMSFYDRHGDPGSPAEPPAVSIESATLSFGDYTFDVSDINKWTEHDCELIYEAVTEQEEQSK